MKIKDDITIVFFHLKLTESRSNGLINFCSFSFHIKC